MSKEESETATQKASDAPQKRVLIVDHDANARQMMGQHIQGAGYDAHKAPSSMKALSMIRQEPFDLVLSDVELPFLDGVEMLAIVRDIPRLADLPFILYNAVADKEVVMAAAKLNIRGYLVKPLKKDALLAQIAAVIGPGTPPTREPAKKANAPETPKA